MGARKHVEMLEYIYIKGVTLVVWFVVYVLSILVYEAHLDVCVFALEPSLYGIVIHVCTIALKTGFYGIVALFLYKKMGEVTTADEISRKHKETREYIYINGVILFVWFVMFVIAILVYELTLDICTLTRKTGLYGIVILTYMVVRFMAGIIMGFIALSIYNTAIARLNSDYNNSKPHDPLRKTQLMGNQLYYKDGLRRRLNTVRPTCEVISKDFDDKDDTYLLTTLKNTTTKLGEIAAICPQHAAVACTTGDADDDDYDNDADDDNEEEEDMSPYDRTTSLAMSVIDIAPVLMVIYYTSVNINTTVHTTSLEDCNTYVAFSCIVSGLLFTFTLFRAINYICTSRPHVVLPPPPQTNYTPVSSSVATQSIPVSSTSGLL